MLTQPKRNVSGGKQPKFPRKMCGGFALGAVQAISPVIHAHRRAKCLEGFWDSAGDRLSICESPKKTRCRVTFEGKP